MEVQTSVNKNSLHRVGGWLEQVAQDRWLQNFLEFTLQKFPIGYLVTPCVKEDLTCSHSDWSQKVTEGHRR